MITSWNKNQSESSMAAASGQMVDQWSFWRLTSGTSQHVESDFAQTQKMSFAFRLNYSYKGKYLFNFSTRWDGVSQFSTGHKWDAFPAGALAWRISDEAFMEKTRSWLDNLKLRVSYGITGNSGGTTAYSTTTQAYVYTASGISINGKIVPFTQYSGTYGSSDLGWEKSYNWNVGLDFGILNGRIDGSVEWFKTTTKGLLFKRTLPITSGLTGWGSPLAIWQNIAQTSNQGVEAKGAYPAGNVVCISLDEIHRMAIDEIEQKLLHVQGFNKIIVNAVDYADLKVFCVALYRAMAKGKVFMFRTAAAIVKVMGGVSDHSSRKEKSPAFS